jgi:hypothetical protein
MMNDSPMIETTMGIEFLSNRKSVPVAMISIKPNTARRREIFEYV